jgi:glycosyltransferase involved in cell wall biosynthesis
VVHLDLEGLGAHAALAVAQRLGIPVTATVHGSYHHAVVQPQAVFALAVRAFNACRRVVARAECDAVVVRPHCTRPIEVIPHGVDGRIFHPRFRDDAVRRSWGADPNTPVLLWVSRCVELKDPGAFIAAAQAAIAAVPATRVVVVGDGEALSRMIEEIPGVISLGVRPGPELARIYASADVMLFPSPIDTWGLVVGEAMASGLAVVAYDRAAANTLIRSGESGITVPTGEREALIAATVALVQDLPRARRLGVAARAVAETYDWPRIARLWQAMWQQVLGNKSAPLSDR